MKAWLPAILMMLICAGSAFAMSEDVISRADLASMYEFASQYDAESVLESIYESAVRGEFPKNDEIIIYLKGKIEEPLRFLRSSLLKMAIPVLLLTMMRSMLPDGRGASSGAAFLLRMRLLIAFSETAMYSLKAAHDGLQSIKQFTDGISPILTLLVTACGMDGTAALVSPGAALAGNISEGLFLKLGMPLCRAALCLALAGCLSREVDLSRLTSLLKKLANWSAGLALALFTGLMALQGNISEGLDGVAVRTARFAFDSAAPIIGSGISDAWDSYASGVMIAKNAVGVSGIAAILAAGLEPVLLCLAALLALHLTAVMLDIFGERETARAAAQIGGICQMALSLCTAGMAIGTILLGAVMAVGKTLIA